MAFLTLFLLAAACWAAPVLDAQEADSCSTAAETSFLQKGLQVKALEPKPKPWDVHMYLVATHHKAGCNLNRNIMRLAFDYLGADFSCQEHSSQHSTITSKGGHNKCAKHPNSRIHWDNNASPKVLEKDIKLAGADGLKVTHAVRDPAMMLVSSYCYHHRGEEYGSPIATWPDIMSMGPEAGMKDVLNATLYFLEQMARIHEMATADVHTSRFEKLTESSESFDESVKAMFDHMFGDLITQAEHEALHELAKTEDLNRGENGASAGSNHSNSDECEDEALAVLQDSDMYPLIQHFRKRVGYA
mmetsp:Transcript_4062/g.7386  ORF Transcript_4062/g.7386 Transcript_4062/m.7386 type:complete len:302 (-) Transcript_4062:66-971(-)